MNTIDKIDNKSKIAIVAVGYNRIKSMKRLLSSLLQAQYAKADVPLVISIDCSGDEELYDYVKRFEWPFGEKYVNIQTERLGLKNHIYKCGDLTSYFKAIVLLEDDLYVSPFFYDYVTKSVESYGNDSRIAQISLYRNEFNGYVGLPLTNQQNGSDTYLMQDVSTWGEVWTEKMWYDFKEWLSTHNENDVKNVDMPITIKNWTKAWSKYYNAYVVDTNKYVVYPIISLSTNFSDAGVHGSSNNSVVQVNLLDSYRDYVMYPFERMVKYDIYYNNMDLYVWLGLKETEVCLDIYGFHSNNGRKYLLSVKKLPFRIVRSFALNMRPIELNVKYNIEGTGLFLYDTEGASYNCTAYKYPDSCIQYFLHGFNRRFLILAQIRYFWNRFKSMYL